MPITNAASMNSSLDRLRQKNFKLFTIYKINFGLRLAGQCGIQPLFQISNQPRLQSQQMIGI